MGDVIPAGTQTYEVQEIGRGISTLHTFDTATPTIHVEPLSSDTKSKDFLGFRIVNTENNKELSRFRASDIVKMRRFMASLGCGSEGLFSTKSDSDIPVEATHGHWDVIHPSEDELCYRQQMFDTHTKTQQVPTANGNDAPPSYAVAVQQLPIGFYFPRDTGIELSADVRAELAFPGTAMSMYDPMLHFQKLFDGHGTILTVLQEAHLC